MLGYACLIAIMSMGKGYHRESETRLHEITAKEGHPTPVVTSAGALIAGLKKRSGKKVSLIAPYMKPLTGLVVDYIQNEGISVVDSIALEIPDNVEVGRQDPMTLESGFTPDLKLSGIDALVFLHACNCRRSPQFR